MYNGNGSYGFSGFGSNLMEQEDFSLSRIKTSSNQGYIQGQQSFYSLGHRGRKRPNSRGRGQSLYYDNGNERECHSRHYQAHFPDLHQSTSGSLNSDCINAREQDYLSSRPKPSLPAGNSGWDEDFPDVHEAIANRTDLHHFDHDEDERIQAEKVILLKESWDETQRSGEIYVFSYDKLLRVLKVPNALKTDEVVAEIKRLPELRMYGATMTTGKRPEKIAHRSKDSWEKQLRNLAAEDDCMDSEALTLKIDTESCVELSLEAHKIPIGSELLSAIRGKLAQDVGLKKKYSGMKTMENLGQFNEVQDNSTGTDPNQIACIQWPGCCHHAKEISDFEKKRKDIDSELHNHDRLEIPSPDDSYVLSLASGLDGHLVYPEELSDLAVFIPAHFRNLIPKKNNIHVREVNRTELEYVHREIKRQQRNPGNLMCSQVLRVLFFSSEDASEFRTSNYEHIEMIQHPPFFLLDSPKEAPFCSLELRWNDYSSRGRARVLLRHPEDVQYATDVLVQNGFPVLGVAEHQLTRDFRCVNILWSDRACSEANCEALFREIIRFIFDRHGIEYENLKFFRYTGFQTTSISHRKLCSKIHRRIGRAALNCTPSVWRGYVPKTETEWENYCQNRNNIPWSISFTDCCYEGEKSAVVLFDEIDYGMAVSQFLLENSPNRDTFHLCKFDRYGVRFLPCYTVPIALPQKVILACKMSLRNLDNEVRLREGSDEITRRNWTRLRYDPRKEPDVLYVEGFPKDTVNAVAEQVRILCSGKQIDCSVQNKSGRLLHGFGLQWVNKVRAESRAVIVVDFLNERINVIGDQSVMSEAISELNRFVSEPNSFEVKGSVVLDQPRFIDIMVDVLQFVIKKYMGHVDPRSSSEFFSSIIGGMVNQEFDLLFCRKKNIRQINFCCTVMQYYRLNKFLDDFNEKIVSIFKSSNVSISLRMECVICLSPIECGAYRLQRCGHAYCVQCFAYQVRSQLGNRNLPLKCQSGGCEEKISIYDLKAQMVDKFAELPEWYLLKPSRHALLRPALDCLLLRDKRFKCCSSPDCYGMFRLTETPSAGHCSSCSKEYCTSCGYEPHPDQTCDVYSTLRQNADKSIAVFMDNRNDTKHCPNSECNAVIQKSAGCNHMHCVMCNTHFCWLCSFSDTSESSVYQHLREKHGNIGGWEIVNGQVIAAPEDEIDEEERILANMFGQMQMRMAHQQEMLDAQLAQILQEQGEEWL